jgi:peptide-methionine (S)-S-oxide reductase
VDFDPEVISYDELLDLFWREHDPTSAPWSTQYANIAFFGSDEQRAAIEASRDRVDAALSAGRRVATQVRKLDRFYDAEDYHQKYYLRNTAPVMRDFTAMFGRDEVAFRESTAAARANALAGGSGCAECINDIASLGLTEEGSAELLKRAGRSGITCGG